MFSRRLISFRRAFTTSDVPFQPARDDLFKAAWKRIVPDLDPPKTPLAFMQPRPSSASKLSVNMVSKHSTVFSNNQVDMVTIPSTTGQMGVLPGHMPSISELNPGLVSVHEENEVTHYFISSGFVFVHSDSIVDILAVEAVLIEHVDPASVQRALVEFTQKLDSASTVTEKIEARIAMHVLNALNSSLSGLAVDS